MRLRQRRTKMPTDKKTILKQVLREECLPALARQAAYFSVANVRDWLRQRNLTCPPTLLVELFMEGRALGLMDEGEYFRMFGNLAGYSRISLARLLDYARERRPAGLELVRHIKEEFLKKSALVCSYDKP